MLGAIAWGILAYIVGVTLWIANQYRRTRKHSR